MIIKDTLGDRVKELMSGNNLSGEQLAEIVGVSFPAVSKWKTENNDISISNLVRLARYFDCTLDYLSGRAVEYGKFKEITGDFGKRLMQLIEEKGKTLYKLDKLGVVPKSRYYRWLSGAMPRLRSLVLIADYFDCTIDYLLGLED